jgi:DNA-binding FadR family transcriptional regulator
LSSAGPVALQRVSVPKASDILATQLRSRIRSGELVEGAALPAERELAAQTGLSRVSVREALRILQIEGLLDIRTGRSGGAKVRRPGRDELSRHLELFVWGRNVPYEQLHEVREALEALAAEGAARRRTSEDLACLREKTGTLEATLGDHGKYLAANLEWHMAVARASHNDLLIGLTNVLSDVIDKATTLEAFDSPEVRAATLRIHQQILAAIIERDADAARRRMLRHVSAAREVALSKSR